MEARGAFRVCLVQNPAFCGFQVARRDSGGVEPPTWAHLCPGDSNREPVDARTERSHITGYVNSQQRGSSSYTVDFTQSSAEALAERCAAPRTPRRGRSDERSVRRPRAASPAVSRESGAAACAQQPPRQRRAAATSAQLVTAIGGFTHTHTHTVLAHCLLTAFDPRSTL